MSQLQATPKHVPPAFCEALVPGVKPVYIPVEVDPDARPLECFTNVRALVEARGGEAVYGWAIYEWVGVLYQAEHHAVWKRPDGTVVDPTPSEGDDTTAFLPAPDLVFNGWQIPTRRWAISTIRVVRQFCEASDTADRLRVSAQRAPRFGEGTIYYDVGKLPADQKEVFWRAHQTREALFPRVNALGARAARKRRKKK